MTQKIPMTKEGYEKLKQELDNIIKVERPKNIRDIEEARSHGDISENAEFHSAKEKQGMLDAKKRELQFTSMYLPLRLIVGLRARCAWVVPLVQP